MIILGLAVIAFVFIVALIIGALYWILWIITAIFAIVAIVSHIKYMEWQKAVPSSTKCPECGAYMLVKTVNAGSSGIAAGAMITSNIGLGSSSTQNHYGQLMTCKVCGHQEYRLTRQTINAMTQKYKGRRTLFGILFAASLIGVLMFNQAIFGADSNTSNAANKESTSIENIQEENDTNSNQSSENEEMKTSVEEQAEEKTESQESSAEVRLNEALGEQLSNHVNSVLTNEIGFTKVEFIDRQGDNDNYSFICDGTYIMVTAFSDEEGEYIRVFEPYTENVLYEDGQLLMTKDELDSESESTDSDDTDTNDNAIYAEDIAVYQIIAEEIVRNCMKDPSSANFPSSISDEWRYAKKGDLIAVQSYVDGVNSFGATVRSDFIVEFYITDIDTYSYEVQYIRIGNDEQGEFIEVS